MADTPNYNNQNDLQDQLAVAQSAYVAAQLNAADATKTITTESSIIAALNADKAATTDPTALANINALISTHQSNVSAANDKLNAANSQATTNQYQISAINSTLNSGYGTTGSGQATDSVTGNPIDTPIKTIDPNSVISLNPVSSGSGSVLNSDSTTVTASSYAGQYLSVDNAALVDSNAQLTYTQPANISKAQLNAADDNATAAWNNLSYYNSIGDNSSTDYQLAKINAMGAQHDFELARDNLEEVGTSAGLSGDQLDARAAAFNIDGLGSSNVDSNGVDVSTLQEDPLNIAGNNDQLMQVSQIDTTNAIPGLTDNSGAPSASDASAAASASAQADKRVRIRAKDSTLYDGLSSSLLFPLNSSSGTNGVIFPYTPTITYNHGVNYQQMTPTHANTDYWLYTNTPAVQIQIAGEFTAQNQAEAQYLMAAIQFFRTASKMHFGENDPNAGLPPPMLTLSGYGDFMFNDLDCIMTNFSMEMPNSVDYIEVQYNGATAWVPSLTTLSVSVVVQQTPKKQRQEFNFTDFASGALLQQKGWI